MVRLRSCPRCEGDMFQEEFLGDTELVCLQCGYHISFELPRQAQPRGPARKAA